MAAAIPAVIGLGISAYNAYQGNQANSAAQQQASQQEQAEEGEQQEEQEGFAQAQQGSASDQQWMQLKSMASSLNGLQGNPAAALKGAGPPTAGMLPGLK